MRFVDRCNNKATTAPPAACHARRHDRRSIARPLVAVRRSMGALAFAVAVVAATENARAEDTPEGRVPAPPPPDFRFSGYVQADWVIHRQSSQDEVNGATGAPLNEDRFTLRRGHVRVDWDKGG